MTNKETIGVILLNLGGPDSLQAVRPFLYNLFSDKQIIRLGPSFMQKPLAWLISTIRSKKTEQYYKLIGGKSPILDITKAQAKALEECLNSELRTQNSEHSFKVFIGMRYWSPFIEDIIPEIYNNGIRKVIALSLYPQYSVTTSGSSISKLKEVLSNYQMETVYISSWHAHPLYIEALVDLIKKGIESFTVNAKRRTQNAEPEVHVLFSAHSLPQKIIDEGDPYADQTIETIQEITKRIPLKWHLSYQSKSGPVQWLEPSTEDKIKELAGEGVKNLLVVPISFISDHIETLYEIDILYKKLAESLGINLKRADSLNTHPAFIKALKDIVISELKKPGSKS
ncbi:MAG: ferrochelatase [Thermodesulfovibrionales bacterium]